MSVLVIETADGSVDTQALALTMASFWINREVACRQFETSRPFQSEWAWKTGLFKSTGRWPKTRSVKKRGLCDVTDLEMSSDLDTRLPVPPQCQSQSECPAIPVRVRRIITYRTIVASDRSIRQAYALLSHLYHTIS